MSDREKEARRAAAEFLGALSVDGFGDYWIVDKAAAGVLEWIETGPLSGELAPVVSERRADLVAKLLLDIADKARAEGYAAGQASPCTCGTGSTEFQEHEESCSLAAPCETAYQTGANAGAATAERERDVLRARVARLREAFARTEPMTIDKVELLYQTGKVWA